MTLCWRGVLRSLLLHVTQGEQELETAQRSMVGSSLEQQRLQYELDSVRATAARLNARISDLVHGEQVG